MAMVSCVYMDVIFSKLYTLNMCSLLYFSYLNRAVKNKQNRQLDALNSTLKTTTESVDRSTEIIQSKEWGKVIK